MSRSLLTFDTFLQCSTKEIPSSHSPSKSTTTSNISTMNTSHRKSSAYHPDFQVHLIDHGIYPDNYCLRGRWLPGPSNEKEILERLVQPRPSLSESRFSDEDFVSFKRINDQAPTEPTVMGEPFSVILGRTTIPSARQVKFTNLKPLTDGTLVDAKPDFYGMYITRQTQHFIRCRLTYILRWSTSSTSRTPDTRRVKLLYMPINEVAHSSIAKLLY